MGGAIILKQSDYIAQIGKQDFPKQTLLADLQSLRAKYACAAFSTVPNVSMIVAFLTQVTGNIQYGSAMNFQHT